MECNFKPIVFGYCDCADGGNISGEPGIGVPAGGMTGQVLTKRSDEDYDTEWADHTGGADDGTNDNAIWVTGIIQGPIAASASATAQEFVPQHGNVEDINAKGQWVCPQDGIYNIHVYPGSGFITSAGGQRLLAILNKNGSERIAQAAISGQTSGNEAVTGNWPSVSGMYLFEKGDTLELLLNSVETTQTAGIRGNSNFAIVLNTTIDLSAQ